MKVLKVRINEHFGQKPCKDNFNIYFKSLVIFTWWALSFAGIFFLEPVSLKILCCISFGISNAGIGFNLFHDAAHGSLSSNKNINKVASFVTCSILGASQYLWKHKHNFLHHQYPNIKEWDDDLETREGLRLSPEQPWGKRYTYQHIYAPLMYAMTTFEWFYMKDFVQYFSGRMNTWQLIPKMKTKDHLSFWASKIIYFGYFVALPLTYFSLSEFFVGFAIVHVTFSLTLAAIFQLAHVMDECDFPMIDKEKLVLDRDWAHLQLSTTTNFAMKNKLVTWFAGGLNYQVEHHLFPNISHTYYPEISPILEKTCKEFDYPYYAIPTYRGAIKSHFKALKKFAKGTEQKFEKLATSDI